MMLSTIGRIVLVPLAFVIAALVTGFVLISLGQERVVQGMTGKGPSDVTIAGAFDLLRLGRVLFSLQTLIPALLLVVVGEVARIRQSMYYVLGGGAALVAVPFLARLGQTSPLETSAVVWQVFATAGFAGGFVYWLIAGRRA